MSIRPEESGAEGVFASWLLRVEAGEEASFEALLAEHAEQADELRRLHEDWRLFAPLLGRAVPGRIEGEQGIVLAPLSGTSAEAGEPASAELLERLGIEVPQSGRYRFRAVIGRGGGGVVLRVWDAKLNRALAMKVVLGRGEERPTGTTPKVDGLTLTRFVDEARIASQLNHPGIVPVHELGLDDTGRAFFTMKLVKGEDLSKVFEHVRTGHDGWNQTRALTVLLRVCESVAFAHEKGVIHRDLKPANVMVGRHGEVYVMDWGLARVLGEPDRKDVRVRPPAATSALHSLRSRPSGETPDSPLYTMDGDVVGTPAYMAPEQAAGELSRMGPHSDVYALGAMLYHLLAGHMPYVLPGTRWNNYALWQRVQEGPPERIEKLAPRTPPELAAICEKAMARDIGARYPDVPALARDLRAFVENRVVAAYETGAWAETKKWVRRNKALAASLAAVVLVSVVGILVANDRAARLVLSERAQRVSKAEAEARAKEAEAAQARAEQQEAQAQRNAYLAAVTGAAAAAEADEPATVRRLLDNAPIALRNWEWRYLSASTDRSLAVIKSLGDIGYSSVVFSPDSKGVAITETDSIPRCIYRVPDGAQTFCLEPEEEFAAFSSDGSYALTARYPNIHRVLESASGTELCRPVGRWPEFSPDGVRVLTISNEDTVLISDSATGAEVCTLAGHEGPINTAAFSYDGQKVLTCSDDHTARIWSLGSGCGVTHMSHPSAVMRAIFGPGELTVITISEDRIIRVWDAKSGIELSQLGVLVGTATDLVLSPDGRWIAAAAEEELKESTIAVWRSDCCEEVLRVHDEVYGTYCSLGFSADCNYLIGAISTYPSGISRAWQLEDSEEVIMRQPPESGPPEAWISV